MVGNVVCIMTTRTAPIDWRRGIRVVGSRGAAKTNCTRVASSINLVGGCDVWVVYELGMQLQMRQYDCNGAAVCTYCVAVIVVCLGRFAMSAVRSIVHTPCVSCDCVLGLL